MRECVWHTVPASPHSWGPVLVGGVERLLIVGAWVAGFSLVSFFFPLMNNIYKLLSLNSMFRKKLTHCAGSLDGGAEILLWIAWPPSSAWWSGSFINCDHLMDLF